MSRYAAPIALLLVAVLLVVSGGKLSLPEWLPIPLPVKPIEQPGFRVLMVYESEDLTKLPPAQKSVLQSTIVREYLNAKCSKGADGKTPDYRILDAHTDTTSDSKWWQDAMKRKRDSLPWIVISDGTTGYEGPLPKTVDEALALFKKYGG